MRGFLKDLRIEVRTRLFSFFNIFLEVGSLAIYRSCPEEMDGWRDRFDLISWDLIRQTKGGLTSVVCLLVMRVLPQHRCIVCWRGTYERFYRRNGEGGR